MPYLKGAPRWRAYVYADANEPDPTATSPRAVLELPLMQIDVAVKDRRVADTTGWVFGTFVYGGGPGGQSGSGWRNVAAVGGMWGDDPNYSGVRSTDADLDQSIGAHAHLGYQGRLSGPVDYPTSSCLSCSFDRRSACGRHAAAGASRHRKVVSQFTIRRTVRFRPAIDRLLAANRRRHCKFRGPPAGRWRTAVVKKLRPRSWTEAF